MIPVGKYKAVATPVKLEDGRSVYAQIGSSKEKQSPQVAICFRIIDGEFAGEELTWFGYFSDAAAPYTVESLRHVGFQGDDLDTIEEQRLDREVNIVVQHEEYKGKVRAKVRYVNPAGGMVIPPMDRPQRQRLAAEMRGLFKSTPATAAPAKNGAAAMPTDAGSHRTPDDDINF